MKIDPRNMAELVGGFSSLLYTETRGQRWALTCCLTISYIPFFGGAHTFIGTTLMLSYTVKDRENCAATVQRRYNEKCGLIAGITPGPTCSSRVVRHCTHTVPTLHPHCTHVALQRIACPPNIVLGCGRTNRNPNNVETRIRLRERASLSCPACHMAD
jgi:hypothetical protein